MPRRNLIHDLLNLSSFDCIVCLAIRIGQEFTDFAPTAYKDMIISVTIPFVAGAIVYYAVFFHEIKKANRLIEEMNK